MRRFICMKGFVRMVSTARYCSAQARFSPHAPLEYPPIPPGNISERITRLPKAIRPEPLRPVYWAGCGGLAPLSAGAQNQAGAFRQLALKARYWG